MGNFAFTFAAITTFDPRDGIWLNQPLPTVPSLKYDRIVFKITMGDLEQRFETGMVETGEMRVLTGLGFSSFAHHFEHWLLVRLSVGY